VVWTRQKAASGWARAVLVNAGQANACTGPTGLQDASASAAAVAALCGCSPDQVLLASTGVIGEPINRSALKLALPGLIENLSEGGLPDVARAMMTTDTRPKTAYRSGAAGGSEFSVAGLAKGSGMIQPNMATMLAFVLTDARLTPEYLQDVLSRGAELSFNRVTVDGDTSTNDCVLALASGQGDKAEIVPGTTAAEDFEAAFFDLMRDLARQIAFDGEGATKRITIRVEGAPDELHAKRAALTVANSPLVKTAFFGQDANWGRIMAALGRSGAHFDPERVDIRFNDAPVAVDGGPVDDMSGADRAVEETDVTVLIDLKNGDGRAEVWTCDLSVDYVKINADYRS
jgi:glutamate N-acetyltransferase/amino-acid N-acetyltransferase